LFCFFSPLLGQSSFLPFWGGVICLNLMGAFFSRGGGGARSLPEHIFFLPNPSENVGFVG
ncbi:hypothetical protein, partial [Pseudomonas putida]|uniref:hypothetical protein n=1 Tax=Pseudomonas putida TaxID=303 RepID=UPI001E4145B8